MSIDRALSIARHPSNSNTRNSEIFSRMDSGFPSDKEPFPMTKYLAVELAKESSTDMEFPEYFHKAGEIIFDEELIYTQKISELQRLCIHTDMPVSDLTLFEGMALLAEHEWARKNDVIPSQEAEIRVENPPIGEETGGKLGEYQEALFGFSPDTKDVDINDSHSG